MPVNLFFNNPLPEFILNEDYYLREQMVKDSHAFLSYYSQPHVHQHILATAPTNLKEAQDEINYCRFMFCRREGAYWSIARRDNDEMIGSIGLYIKKHLPNAELSYDLNPAYWRQGITTRALRHIIDFGFQTLQFEAIKATVTPLNTASIHLLKRLDFQYDNRSTRYFQGNDHYVDIFSLSNKDYQAMRKHVAVDYAESA